MKPSEVTIPAGATHAEVTLDGTERKRVRRTVEHIADLDPLAGTLAFYKRDGKRFTRVPHQDPERTAAAIEALNGGPVQNPLASSHGNGSSFQNPLASSHAANQRADDRLERARKAQEKRLAAAQSRPGVAGNVSTPALTPGAAWGESAPAPANVVPMVEPAAPARVSPVLGKGRPTREDAIAAARIAYPSSKNPVYDAVIWGGVAESLTRAQIWGEIKTRWPRHREASAMKWIADAVARLRAEGWTVNDPA